MNKSILYVKFINGNSCSDKTYKYLVDDSIIAPFESKFYDKRITNYSYARFKIENKSGYNYRNSDVIFIALKEATSGDLSENLVEIGKITATPYTYIVSESERRLFVKSISQSNTDAAEKASISTLLDSGCSLDNDTTVNITPLGAKYINNRLSQTNVIGVDNCKSSISIDDFAAKGVQTEVDCLSSRVAALETIVNKKENNTTENVKENNKMFENMTKNLKFGKATDVRMSIYGPAFESAEHTWVAYDETTGDYIDVTDLLMDMDNFCYMMPVGADSVSTGDYIMHLGRWARVLDVDKKSGRMAVEVMFRKEVATIVPTKSPFGFNFYTKLMPLMGNFMTNASKDNPFGMIPMMMMLKSENKNDMLPLMFVMSGANGGMDMSNPFMLAALMGDNNNSDDIMKYMFMAQAMQSAQKPAKSSGFFSGPMFGTTNEDECEDDE